MRIDDLLRQQRSADIMDPPALRLSREVWETNRLFQSYENPLPHLTLQDLLPDPQLSLQDALSDLSQLNLRDMLTDFPQLNLQDALGDLSQLTLQDLLPDPQLSLQDALGDLSQLTLQDLLPDPQLSLQDALSDLSQLNLRDMLTDFPQLNLQDALGDLSQLNLQDLLPDPQLSLQDALGDLSQLNLQDLLPDPQLSLQDALGDLSQLTLQDAFLRELPSWSYDGSDPEREEFLSTLLKWLTEKLQQFLQGRIILHVLSSILLPIFLHLHSTGSNNQMEKRLAEKIMNALSEKQIVRKMEEVRPNLTYRKRYVVAVTDRLRLRGEPSLEAPVLAFLLPNTLVEEIEQHESWSLVEFFDYKDRSVKKGWVYRDYLQAIQPEKG